MASKASALERVTTIVRSMFILINVVVESSKQVNAKLYDHRSDVWSYGITLVSAVLNTVIPLIVKLNFYFSCSTN